MKMRDILRVARGLSEPSEGLWGKIKGQINKNMLKCAECGRNFVGSKSQRQKAAKGKRVLCGSVCMSANSSQTMAKTNLKYGEEFSARMKGSNKQALEETKVCCDLINRSALR